MSGMGGYRRVLGLPGVRSLILLMFVARMPATAAGLVLTLHVAVGMDRGYGAAGLVGAVATVGIALGAPVMGRVVDRYGLRRMLLITMFGEAAFWLTAPLLPYPALLGAAMAGGFLVLPAMSIGRQCLAALVPPEHRRTAYSMDSISIELSYMTGPTLAVLVATQLSTGAALIGVGLTVLAAGTLVFALNPPVRSDAEVAAAGALRPPRREWLTAELVGVLVIGAGAIYVLTGMEVAVVAELRSYGQLDWTGVVMIAACLASIVGGLVHGAVRRSLPLIVLMTLLSVLCVPVGLAGPEWWLLALVLVPMNLACAPTLASTGEEVARLAPAAVRGEANGVQSAAFTLGAAAGAPVAGFVMDHTAPAWGFVAAGAGGLLLAGLALVLRRRASVRPAVEALPA
jgi:MFS family permease